MQIIPLMTRHRYTLIIELNYASITTKSHNRMQTIEITQNHCFSHNHIITHKRFKRSKLHKFVVNDV